MNSWIVQANPEQFLVDWYLEEYAKSHSNELDWWPIHKYHEPFVSIGDEVYVWKAASEPSRRQKPEYHKWLESIGRTDKVSGIFAKGKVARFPRPHDPVLDDLEQFEKYLVSSFNFSDEDLVIDCIYEKPNNIKVRKPLLKEKLREKLGKSHNTKFSSFLKNSRGRRSVLLEPSEADIIRSLL